MSEDQFTANLMLCRSLTIRQGKFPSQRLMLIHRISRARWKRSVFPMAVYDLIIGNVLGARAADDPDPSWQVPVQEACAVTTRSQAKKAGEHIPLKVPGTKESPVIDREKLKQMQRDDKSLQKF